LHLITENGRIYTCIFCRLSITYDQGIIIPCYDSFLPSTIRQWDSLNPSIGDVDSISKFKTEIRKPKDISQAR